MDLVAITRELRRKIVPLRFGPSVAHFYLPIEYARDPHEQYLKRFGAGRREVILVGMNPGPWGMAQTGVPFGEVVAVRDWMGISGNVSVPENTHPRVPVLGFECHRSEVSGRRLWGWAKATFGSPDHFFERFFVVNYCPLLFLEHTGRNLTPDKLPTAQREPLIELCGRALRKTVETMQPKFVIGVGRFAEARCRIALQGLDVAIGQILHPSPASPHANLDWEKKIIAQLRDLGIR
ncbi:MAG: single-stranded DNA-binding protein [Planctomycetes bacterium]|nr:single-stranded DNA-binding protein [Planctomycetota bacterium]